MKNRDIIFTKWILFLIFLGMIIRIVYFSKFGIFAFQHDFGAHIELIKYISSHWTLPMASQGLEYPQQPLYYLITAAIYSVLAYFDFMEENILHGIGFFSLLCSFIFLYYSDKFIALLTASRWVRGVAIAYLAFTPSIVYISARINNDVLVMALSSFSLYYIIKSYKSNFVESFTPALIGVSLLFMTKLSAATIEILFFTLLLMTYFKAHLQEIKSIQQRMYIFGLVGIFLLGFSLLRIYLPIENDFQMVISSGDYEGQSIHNIDFGYFSSFYLVPLLETGYSFVFGRDEIRYSFLTYQYGTMFFGEFDYKEFFYPYTYVKIIMQAILSFGLIYIVGLFGFLIRFFHFPLLYKILFGIVLINFILIVKYVLFYPSICNTDFRYFAGSLPILAIVFALGLDYLRQFKIIYMMLNLNLFLLFLSEILFYIVLFQS